MRHHVKMMQHLAGPDFPIDVGVETAYSAGAWDRAEADTDSIGAGTARQIQAIQASGDRTGQLGRIIAPTLVIHGDHDLIVHPSGGRATADAIRGARLTTIPGMGHHLAPGLLDRLVELVADQVREGATA